MQAVRAHGACRQVGKRGVYVQRMPAARLMVAGVCGSFLIAGALTLSQAAGSGNAAAAPAPAAAEIKISYPESGSLFPPDILPPTFLWRDASPDAAEYQIEIQFGDGSRALRIRTHSEPLQVGEVDERCINAGGVRPQLTPDQAATRTWKPDTERWETIKKRSVRAPATVTITGYRDPKLKQAVSRGQVTIQTSTDPVGAPIFYRDVPLIPVVGERGVIKPLPESATKLITWRLKSISEPSSRKLIAGFPTCANCHSFSRDGKMLGLDVDGPQNDKGLYAMVPVKQETVIRNEYVIKWNSFQTDKRAGKRFGFMSQISPDGHYIVTSIEGRAARARGLDDRFYNAGYNDLAFGQVFYPTRGILAWYSRDTGKLQPLPGADDPDLVQASAVWSPDGKYIVFLRAKGVEPYPAGAKESTYANSAEETQIQYDLYRIPFNDGRGGVAEPIPGGGQNGKSNSFPKVSPDGRWIVWVQAHNGLLMRPDSELYIMPAEGGTPRRLNCNAAPMNSWHSWSPNGRWLVFSSKRRGPYTRMYLTHIDEQGNDTPAIIIEDATAANRAVNIPEFVNVPYDGLQKIDSPATESYRLFDVALDLSKKNQYAEAVEVWNKALELDPDETKARYNLGVALAATGKTDEAIAQLRRVLETNPGDDGARGNLGVLLAKSGRLDEAIPILEKALEQNPADAQAHGNLGSLLAEKGRMEEAIAHFRSALESDPESADAHNNLAVALARTGHPADAIPHFEKALLADPNSVALHYAEGLALVAAGRPDDAIGHFERVLALDPNHAKAHGSLGAALAAKGRLDQAIPHYEKSLAVEPNYPEVENNLGIALARQGQLRDAIPHFEKALAGPGESLETHVNLGLALAQVGRMPESIPHFEKALAANPEAAQLHDYLGRVLLATGRASDAIPHLERVVRATPESPTAHFNLGNALYDGAGKPQAALAEWREALRLAPNHAPAMNRIARLQATSSDAALRNGPEAVQLAERAVQAANGAEPAFVDTLAAAYAEAGRFAEAVETAKRAKDLATQRGDARLSAEASEHVTLYEGHRPLR